jgi:S1-C subfamily serine protease
MFRTIITSLVTSAIACAVFLGLTQTPRFEGATPQPQPPTARPVTTSPLVVDPLDGTPAIVAQAEPAVVSVIVTKDLPVYERTYDTSPFDGDPFFSPFFRPVPQLRQNGTREREVGGGTAFFVSTDGLLLTNKHVVNDEDASYTVLLNDGRKLSATVVATDPGNDIALLQVDADGQTFTALPLSSTEPRLGEAVVAIGNALAEFRNTVSVGVISGLSRSITAGDGRGMTEHLTQILQTDAGINPGNSGGPLLNRRGEVLGMNTAVAQGAENIGFAIAAADLSRAVESYRRDGKIVRPYLGIRYVPITKELQEKNKLAVEEGVLVSRGETTSELAVLPGSPADKAGLRENDIITAIDGQVLDAEHSLVSVVQRKAVGATVTLTILRQGETLEVPVTLEAMPE